MQKQSTTTEVQTHTPGPWTCHVVIDGRADLRSDMIQPEYCINRKTNFGGASAAPIVSRAEAAANARLIADSPDLLDFVRAVANWFHTGSAPLSAHTLLFDDDVTVQEAAERLIAKVDAR